MTEIIYETLKDALVDWTYASGSVYLTDNEEGPEGVIGGADGIVRIEKEVEYTAVYYSGKDEYLELLKDMLFRVSEERNIKLFAEGYDIVFNLTG